MSAKRVLVTGADGFIGSHLTELLVREGYDVRAFVFYNSFGSLGWLDDCTPDLKGHFEVVAGDVRDSQFVRKALEGRAWVFHLAALISIPYSYQAPDAFVDTNVKGTLNVLQAATELNVERVIHTSTSEVYGTARHVPIDEEHILQAQSPYSASKIGADQIALSFYRSFKTPVTIARPFNTYGPRQSIRAVIPRVITQLAAGETTLRLGNLRPTRDFNYIADTTNGFLAVARAERALGEVINLGTGFDISIGDVAKMIADLMGISAEIESDQRLFRPETSEVYRLCACNKKAHDLLNWTPALRGRDGLRLGLEKTIAWFRESANLRNYNSVQYIP